MARIRSLKPDLWMSPQVMNLGHGARLLFIGLITQADDEGRGTADLRRLKASIFGGDDITSSDVRRMLDECDAQGLVTLYDSQNHGLVYALPSWKSHQSIDRPRKSLYPEPVARRTLVEPSPKPREGLEGSGMEGKGREGGISGARAREGGFESQSPPPDVNDVIERVQRVYPAGTYRAASWLKAAHFVARLLDEGIGETELLDAATAYGIQQHAKGKTGTEFILSPAKFFESEWRGPFPIPPNKSEQRQDANVAAGLAFLQGETS